MKKIAYADVPIYLKQGYILMIGKDKTLVRKQNHTILLSNENWHTKLNENDFYDLYKDMQFYLYVEPVDTIDEKKDEAYYQWRNTYL